ncbi:MAG: alpha/beta hydrolase [Clostridiales bacterium]|nr:alpha/beta hydrolase [Clostridiales bacterium]
MKIYIYEDRKDVYLDAHFPKSTGQERMFPAAVICPGGGYRIVGTTEARPVSDKFLDAGFAAFILHYTVGEGTAFDAGEGWPGFPPARDLAAALRLIHDRAGEYGIDTSHIVLSGFSAGGHLCAASCFSGVLAEAGLMPKALMLTYPMGGGLDSGGAGRPQPDFDIARMQYAEASAVKTLPTFMWHAKDDEMVPFAVAERLAARLEEEGIPNTFLVYEHGIHARPFYDADWWGKALDWLAAL